MTNNFTQNTRFIITGADGMPVKHPGIPAHLMCLESFGEAKHRLDDLIKAKAASRGQATIVRIEPSGDWIPINWDERVDAAMAPRPPSHTG
jgi:hypothetical protein